MCCHVLSRTALQCAFATGLGTKAHSVWGARSLLPAFAAGWFAQPVNCFAHPDLLPGFAIGVSALKDERARIILWILISALRNERARELTTWRIVDFPKSKLQIQLRNDISSFQLRAYMLLSNVEMTSFFNVEITDPALIDRAAQSLIAQMFIWGFDYFHQL